jgi:hypothetical protein
LRRPKHKMNEVVEPEEEEKRVAIFSVLHP